MTGPLVAPPREVDSLRELVDGQQRLLADLARRNGGTLTFSTDVLADDPPRLVILRDDAHHSITVRLES